MRVEHPGRLLTLALLCGILLRFALFFADFNAIARRSYEVVTPATSYSRGVHAIWRLQCGKIAFYLCNFVFAPNFARKSPFPRNYPVRSRCFLPCALLTVQCKRASSSFAPLFRLTPALPSINRRSFSPYSTHSKRYLKLRFGSATSVLPLTLRFNSLGIDTLIALQLFSIGTIYSATVIPEDLKIGSVLTKDKDQSTTSASHS